MSIEVMKQALEALEKLWLLGDYAGAIAAPPIQALRIAIAAHGSQAIEQAEKAEPVACVNDRFSLDGYNDEISAMLPIGTKLYLHPPTAPAQQPLTDEQIIQIAIDTKTAEPGTNGYILPMSFARAIEAHIKGASL